MSSVIVFFPHRVLRMDYRFRLGSLGYSFTSSELSDSWGTVGPRYILGRRHYFFYFVLTLLFPILAPRVLPFSSVSSYFILAVPMRECFGKHSCMSYTFLIAMLNGTRFIPT